MKKFKRIAILGTIVFLLILLFSCLHFVSINNFHELGIHEPSKELRQEWDKIEDILDQKQQDVVISIDSLLQNLVKQENDVTVLLDQKASTQIGGISIVVAIILGSFGFFIKDAGKILSPEESSLFLFLNFLIIIIFIFSIYYSYHGFAIRDDFASYNVQDFFKIMSDKESNLKTMQISDILENYQIYTTNIVLNQNKAGALLLATGFFTAGVIGFALVSLWMMFLVTKHKGRR